MGSNGLALLFFIWNEWTSLIIRTLKLNRLRGTKGEKNERKACSELQVIIHK